MPTPVFVGAYGPKGSREHAEGLHTRLKVDRSNFDAHWQDLASFLLPRRVRFSSTDRNRGDKRNQNIIDSTGRFAARTLQSGLHAGLTSPARPWMKLSTPDPELAAFGPVKEWLHVTTQRMLTIFGQTNLYNGLPVLYGDLGVFGTGAIGIMPDTRDLFRAYSYPIGSYCLGMDRRGLVNTFTREYELTVRQVVEEFGGRNGLPAERGREIDWSGISLAVKNLWDNSNYEQAVPVVWVVTPNINADPQRFGAKYLPFMSCHVEPGNDSGGALLRESGFETFPILAPRWDITGEDSYGTDCPGMTALPDVRMLQIMQRRKGQAIEKMINPPLQGPSALRNQKTSLLPGDITYVDVREGMTGLRSVHDVTLNLEHLQQDAAETRYRIQRAFYEDLFLMLAQSDYNRGSQPITAREVEERHEEKLLALGPVLERTNDELLDPLVDRVYQMMDSAGLIPEPPEDLNGVNLKVEYTSIMAQAQRLVGVVGQDRFLQTVVPMMDAFPGIRHKIDVRQIVDNYGEMLGVDPRTIVPNEEADQAEQAEAQAQQAAQAAEVAAQGARAAKDLAAAPMDGDTALTALVGAQQ